MAGTTHSGGHGLLQEIEDNPDFLLYLLDMPISFHRAYVPITGKVTAALMLSWAVQITEEQVHASMGWFARTTEQWTDEIGLSKDEQQTAKERLSSLNLLEVRKQRDATGFKHWNEYRVNMSVLAELLKAHAAKLKRGQAH
jgi:hypothetical protein